MKTNELRIGNWVSFEDHLIKQQRIVFLSEKADLSMVEPILLTEDWLVKLGFDKAEGFSLINTLTLDLRMNKSLHLICFGTPNEMLFLRETDTNDKEDLICIHNFDYHGKLYVHKLQNFYHALKGEELELKE